MNRLLRQTSIFAISDGHFTWIFTSTRSPAGAATERRHSVAIAESPGGSPVLTAAAPASSSLVLSEEQAATLKPNTVYYWRVVARNPRGQTASVPPQKSFAIDPSLPPGIYENWTRDVEMNVLKLMISESSAATVTFNAVPQINENDFVQFRVTYVLNLTSKSDASKSSLRGVAEFDVRRSIRTGRKSPRGK